MYFLFYWIFQRLLWRHCKIPSELSFRKEGLSFVSWPYHVWVTGWPSLMWPLLYYSAFIILSLFPSVFYKLLNLHTFLTVTEFSRVMCGKVRGRWVWPTQLCCHKSLPWNLLCWKNCFCAVSLGKWTVTGIAHSSRTEALQLPRCGWVSSALSMLCIAQLHERNHFGRSSITSKL